ncbi:MAG: hypothetical protein H5U40_01285 [Polyangiaceae bacterium]|nr:hypothetical protein [Polyangiaceae bacterium]
MHCDSAIEVTGTADSAPRELTLEHRVDGPSIRASRTDETGGLALELD